MFGALAWAAETFRSNQDVFGESAGTAFAAGSPAGKG
jgi:hypothetical protein